MKSRVNFVKQYGMTVIKHPFFAGSFVMVLGSNIYNVGQFIYHLLAGRMLGVALYGDLAAIISLLGIIGIVQLSLNLTIVRFIAGSESDKEIGNFVKWIKRWSILLGVGLSVVALLGADLLQDFLNIHDIRVLYLFAPMLFVFVLANSYRSVLQGLLKFGGFVASLVTEQVVKLTLSVVLVILGFEVFGAVIGLAVGVGVSLLLAGRLLSPYLKGDRGKRPELAPLFAFSMPVLAQGLAMTSMYTTDLILVKHYFSPESAGLYAALAVLGRIVFFGTSPVTQVMFPLVVKRYTKGEVYGKIMGLSVLMVVGFVAVVIIFYVLFPGLAINVLFGADYLGGSSYLWWFALFMGLLALANNLTQFYLSVGKTKIVLFFILAAIIQAIGIHFDHATLIRVIQISVVSAVLLCISLLLYLPYSRNAKN